MVTWTSESEDEDHYGPLVITIQAQRYGSSGSREGDEFQVNVVSTVQQYDSAIASLTDESYIVIWTSRGTFDTAWQPSIRGRRYKADGVPLGGEFQVNSESPSRQADPAVGRDGSGGFVVAWRADSSVGDDSSYWSIQGRQFSQDTSPLGAQFQVNTTTQALSGKSSRQPGWRRGLCGVLDSTYSSGTDTDFKSIQAQRYFTPGSGGQPFTCVANSQTLCLQDDRFEVKAYWRTFRARPAPGR